MRYDDKRSTLSLLDNKCAKLIICSSPVTSTSPLQEQWIESSGVDCLIKARVGKSQQIKPQERNKEVTSFCKYICSYNFTIRHTKRNHWMDAEKLLVESLFRYLDFAASGIKNFQRKDSISVNRDLSADSVKGKVESK